MNKDLNNLNKEVHSYSISSTWLAAKLVKTGTNPTLKESMRHFHTYFLEC
uniref:Uncharacterized protein n=1 Tax=Sus scrofa TaxID=9823 RepID=A0A4X1UJ34_PIG